MASFDGAIRISTKMDTSGFDRGIRTMESGFGKLSSTLGKVAGALTAGKVVSDIVRIGKQALETAAEVQAANSQFEQAFGALGGPAEEMVSRVAAASGIVETRLRGAATSIFAFARTTGMASAQALDLTERALTAAADSAAYYDRSLEDTSETLKSFLKGNFENDAALGLSCTETTRNAAANKLYGKSFAELAEDQKQLTLLQMVEDANALSGAMGQAAREADGWENVTGNLKEAWRQLMAVAGEPLLAGAVPIVKSLTSAVGELTGFVRDQVDAFESWIGSLDLGPIQTSFRKFKTTVVSALKTAWDNLEPLRTLLKGLFQFLIETGFPAVLDAMSAVMGAVNTVWSVIQPVVNAIANALDAIVGKIKSGAAWLYRLFGMEPPDWTQDQDDPDNSFDVDTDGAVEDFNDLTDAAEDAEDAIEDADQAAAGGSGSEKRDVLGFDEITKLSEQSSGGSGGAGSSGSGSKGSPSSGTSPSVSQAAKANEALQRGAEQTKDSINDLNLSVELLIGNLGDAVKQISRLMTPRSVTTTLNLVKGKGFDQLLEQWNSLTSEAVLKKLLHQLTVVVQTRVEVAVQAQISSSCKTKKPLQEKEITPPPDKTGEKYVASSRRPLGPSNLDLFLEGISDGWEGFSQFIEGFGDLYTMDVLGGLKTMGSGLATTGQGSAKLFSSLFSGLLGGGSSKSSKNSLGILDTVKKWWSSLTGGKATKTLDLKGGSFSGGSGGFAQGVKQWEGLTDETITKTLQGKTTSAYASVQTDWRKWTDVSIFKTAKGSKSSTYASVKKDWTAWKSSAVAKTANGVKAAAYTEVKGDWAAWRDDVITKTVQGTKGAAYSSVKGDWNGWTSAAVTKTTLGSKGSTYSAVKTDWSGWKSSSVTKTAEGARAQSWYSIKNDWDNLKDKSVTGKITLTATISNIKSWMNSNVITPLNHTIHKVLPRVSIPMLARGGVVNRATLAQIGEAGREAVLPLERNTGWMDELAARIATQLDSASAGTGQMVVEVHIGSEKVAEHVIQSINASTRATGSSPLYF